MLSCVIYTIISNYVCINYLDCEPKTLSELPVSFGGGLNIETIVKTKYWVLEFQIVNVLDFFS